jgi:DNA-binding transcriptional regulator/RsmH inhibitor MraZ
MEQSGRLLSAERRRPAAIRAATKGRQSMATLTTEELGKEIYEMVLASDDGTGVMVTPEQATERILERHPELTTAQLADAHRHAGRMFAAHADELRAISG